MIEPKSDLSLLGAVIKAEASAATYGVGQLVILAVVVLSILVPAIGLAYICYQFLIRVSGLCLALPFSFIVFIVTLILGIILLPGAIFAKATQLLK